MITIKKVCGATVGKTLLVVLSMSLFLSCSSEAASVSVAAGSPADSSASVVSDMLMDVHDILLDVVSGENYNEPQPAGGGSSNDAMSEKERLEWLKKEYERLFSAVSEAS